MARENSDFDHEDFKENEHQSRLRLDKLKRTWGISNAEERKGMILSAKSYLSKYKTSRDPNEQSKIDAYNDFLNLYK
ncbi:MAG: hypothetical protein WCP14_03810 [bacterium]